MITKRYNFNTDYFAIYDIIMDRGGGAVEHRTKFAAPNRQW